MMNSIMSNIIYWWIEIGEDHNHNRNLNEIIQKNDNDASSSSQLTREQQGLLNFDEIVALWCFILVVWYGFFRFRNWKISRKRRRTTMSTTTTTTTSINNDTDYDEIQYGFSPIHWLIVSIAIMGLANFLFSVRLLQVMGHRSSTGIGGGVLKLSYVSEYQPEVVYSTRGDTSYMIEDEYHSYVVYCFLLIEYYSNRLNIFPTFCCCCFYDYFTFFSDMFLACLRHPCTLSLGVLAPKIAFGSDRYYYFPSNDYAVGGESIKSTAMCLAALSCAQVIVRLTDNLMILFRYRSVKESVDFFEYVLDAIFLVWMTNTLYRTTIEISRDGYHGHSAGGGLIGQNRWLAWWKSPTLLFFWILYTIFVTVSTVLVLMGMLSFFGVSSFGTEHFMYADYKVHAINDLLLLSGIAIVLRPKPIGHSEIFDSDVNNDDEEGRDNTDIDYSLLLAESEDSNLDYNNNEEEGGEEIAFEMTSNTATSSMNETIGTI